MNNTAERKTKSRTEREADLRAARRAEQAGIVSGLKTILEPDEQLLGFARGRIAGGLRGKLNIGMEALFAPIINIGLTERRLVLQHIHPESGRPSEMLPHFFPLGDIASIAFSDIETYGAEVACRLVVHMTNELYCRVRLRGQTNFESAQSIAEVFTSLTGPRRDTPTPTQRVCSQCLRMLDQPYKFCPYCGQQQPPEARTTETYDEPKSEDGVAEAPVTEADAVIDADAPAHLPTEPLAEETMPERNVEMTATPETSETEPEAGQAHAESSAGNSESEIHNPESHPDNASPQGEF